MRRGRRSFTTGRGRGSSSRRSRRSRCRWASGFGFLGTLGALLLLAHFRHGGSRDLGNRHSSTERCSASNDGDRPAVLGNMSRDNHGRRQAGCKKENTKRLHGDVNGYNLFDTKRESRVKVQKKVRNGAAHCGTNRTETSSSEKTGGRIGKKLVRSLVVEAV